jgi:hypothetical protein
MNDNPFDSPNLMLNRAREHREELNSRAKRFFDENPCVHFTDRDSDTGHYLRKAKLEASLPSSLWPIAADAFNNLRSALDQAVSASVVRLNPTAALNGVGFCFGKSKTHFENTIARAPKVINPRVFDVMSFFQPYVGGNDRLAVLNVLANANKHRSLISLGASVETVEVALLELPGRGPILRPYWDSTKNELVISRTADSREPRYDLNVAFFIALKEVEGFDGYPIIQIIDYLCAVVGAFVTGMESDIELLPSIKPTPPEILLSAPARRDPFIIFSSGLQGA